MAGESCAFTAEEHHRRDREAVMVKGTAIGATVQDKLVQRRRIVMVAWGLFKNRSKFYKILRHFNILPKYLKQ